MFLLGLSIYLSIKTILIECPLSGRTGKLDIKQHKVTSQVYEP